MKFGIAVIPYWGAREIIDLVQQADNSGFDHAWICDQTFFFDPFPLISAASQKVKNISLGVGVTNPYTRTAYQIARSVGVIGELQQKPVILGVGAGNRRELLNPLGIEQISAAPRIKEFIEIIQRLSMGETVNYESESMTLKGVSLKFEVHHPPKYYIAARGPLTMKLSGEIGDGVIIGDLISDDGLDYAFEHLDKGLTISKRSRDDFECVLWTTCFVRDTDDDDSANKAIRPWIAHNLAASPPVVQSALGMDEDRVKVMRTAYAKGGSEEAAKYVNDSDIDKLSIVGPPERCAATINRLKDRGIDHLTILMFSHELKENQELIHRLSNEVFPLLR